MSLSPRLTDRGCRERRCALLQAVDADLIVITNPRHLFYYSAFMPDEPSLAAWGRSFLLIDPTRDGEATLIAHNFASNAAEEAFVDSREIWRWYDGATEPAVQLFPEAVRRIARAVDARAPKRLGIEAGWFPALRAGDGLTAGDGSSGAAPVRAELVDVTAVIEEQRRSKDPDELELISFAFRVTEAGFEAARRELKTGMTEIELYSIIQSAMTRRAGHAVSLIGDFLSGERTLQTAGPPSDRVIREGDSVILDMAPVVNGYRGDFTATVVVGDVPSRQRDLEQALHAAMSAGESVLRPGVICRDVHAAVKEAIEGGGFAGSFGHHAGHGLGLGHPEQPFLVPGSEEMLRAGEVITLEPGAYGDGFAGRIENIYLITDNGPERLTHHNTSFSL